MAQKNGECAIFTYSKNAQNMSSSPVRSKPELDKRRVYRHLVIAIVLILLIELGMAMIPSKNNPIIITGWRQTRRWSNFCLVRAGTYQQTDIEVRFFKIFLKWRPTKKTSEVPKRGHGRCIKILLLG